MDEQFCCRCKEDFPIAQEPATWRMGEMRGLKKAPKSIRTQYQEWLDHEHGGYLCGNCYFDLTDFSFAHIPASRALTVATTAAERSVIFRAITTTPNTRKDNIAVSANPVEPIAIPSAESVAREALSRHPLKLLSVIGRGPFEELVRIFAAALESEKCVSPASAAPVVDEHPPRRLIGSSRHPHFTAEDHERMKETLDALSDYPSEEEAEAALRACGTSGKEVVNEFIERLLKENLELKDTLTAATAAYVEQTNEILCACRTFALNGFNNARAYLDSCDFVHTVNGCPLKPVTDDEGAR